MDKKNLLLLVVSLHCVQSLMESSSDSSSDEDVYDHTESVLSVFSITESLPRQTGYLQIVFSYSDWDFFFLELAEQRFNKYLTSLKLNSSGQMLFIMVALNQWKILKMLLITLQYLGNQGAIRLWAVKFNTTESAVLNCIRLVCEFLFEKQSHFIRWPSSEVVRKSALLLTSLWLDPDSQEL